MNEGLQILLFDIYFKDYMTRTQNSVQKIKFYHFWWLALKTTFLAKNSYESKVKY